MVETEYSKSSWKRRNAANNNGKEIARSDASSSYRLLDPSDINQLQKVYPDIVDDLKESFSRLNNPDLTWRMAKKEEMHILGLLASLQPLCTVKSSIFLIRGLQPTIFALLFDLLPLTNRWNIQNAPDSHFAILRLAQTYAQTHGQFIASSDISVVPSSTSAVNNSSTAPHVSSSIEQLTVKHYGQILVTITELLHHFHLLGAQAQNSVVEWLQQLTGLIVDQLWAIKKVREMFALRSTMLELIFHLHQFKGSDQRKQFVRCMYKLQAFDLLQQDGPRCLQLIASTVGRLIKSAGELSGEQFRIVWSRIPVAFLIRLFGLVDPERSSAGRKAVARSSSQHSSTFPAEQIQPRLGQMRMEAFEFQFLANFLFDRKCITMVLDEQKVREWVQSAAEHFYDNLRGIEECRQSSTSLGSGAGDIRTAGQAQEDQQEGRTTTTLGRWQFLIGQLALFCIVNRMRTPIGRNPLETFTKFENELRSLVTQTAFRRSTTTTTVPASQRMLHLHSSPAQQMPKEDTASLGTAGSSAQDDEEFASMPQEERSRELRPEEDWFRVRMLLHAIDSMEKLMGYAVHGSTLEISPEIPLNSRQFFLVNQGSCTDWLKRTALPLMAVAFSNGAFAQIVRLSGFVFAELERKHPPPSGSGASPFLRLDSATLFTICWLVRALVELGAAQSIRGVRQWAERLFGTRQQSFQWCKYAELLALARVEEALDGFLALQQQERTAFLSQAQPNGGPGEGNGRDTTAKVHAHVLRAMEEMAWRAAAVLRNPRDEQRLHDVYCQKRIAITAAAVVEKEELMSSEAQRQFSRVQWQRVMALSSWQQPNASTTASGLIEPSAEHVKHLPWELRGRLMDTEVEVLHLLEQRLRNEYSNTSSSSNNSYGRTGTGEALYALQDGLSDTAQFLLMAGQEPVDGLEHARLAFVHSLCTAVQHLQQQRTGAGLYVHHQQHFEQGRQQQQRSPVKQGAGNLPVLLELDLGELLRNWKSQTLHRLELGQACCSWMHRLYGGQKEHAFVLRKAHREMAQLAMESGNPQLASLHFRLAGVSSSATAANAAAHQPFAGAIPAQARQFEPAFFLGQQQRSTEHQFAAAGSILLQQQQQFAAFGANAAAPPPSPPPPPGFSPLVLDQHQPGAFQLQHPAPPPGLSPFIPADAAATGMVPMLNGEEGLLVPHQVLLSEEFDGDSLKLLPAEVGTMLQFGINIHSEYGHRFQTLIGSCPVFDEFCASVRQAFPLTDLAAMPTLMALEQPTFQHFWLTLKHRQYRLFELALNSHLRFLENLFPGKSHVQTVEVILRLLKMLACQPEWFVRIQGIAGGGEPDAWMDRVALGVWTDAIPQLFAYLGHPKAAVREVLLLLLHKIGLQMPHAICYPAIVLADEADEKGSKFWDDLLLSAGIGLKRRAGNQQLQEEVEAAHAATGEFAHLCLDADPEGTSSSRLVECCRSLVNSLAASHPRLVTDTRAFCRALRRIALLHEEQWLYLLGQFDAQVTRLLRALPAQQATADEQHGGQGVQGKQEQRFHVYLDKVLASLHTLHASTCASPALESENERQFAGAFGEQIRLALDTLEQHNLPGGSARKTWEPFRKILTALNRQAMRRTALCLNIPKMSPFLAELASTAVPMPGQDHQPFGELITVQKMATNLAYVLPTKTRPKKLAFTGSDGKTYTFLFKGQENLYMDARLMQLLRVCNAIFEDVKNQRQMDMEPAYGCVTYSVTPLGQRSGLLQWVEGAVPLFQIYRKWRVRQAKLLTEVEENKQQKMAAAATAMGAHPQQQQKKITGKGGLINIGVGARGDGSKSVERGQKRQKNGGQRQKRGTEGGGGAGVFEPERPTEQFHSKLRAVFGTSGVAKEQLADRQRWPRRQLEQVLAELVEETPRDILARELWMHASTSAAWWARTQRFARTAAVGSMLGALVGLGDRHLDNVLVDLHTGHVVHVDYNVCFDKGHSLRVPELVPFRLTGNIAQSLGPTGIEGTFRQSGERVLEMLRADKQVLLQLLETFKLDPMLDFSFLQGIQNGTAQSHQDLATAVVHRIGRKLLGHELVPSRRHLQQREADKQPAPGMLKLAVMAAMNGQAVEGGGGGDRAAGNGSGTGAKTAAGGTQEEGAWVESERMSVVEQVDLLIREAMDPGNLALMYEGWTAWV